MRFDGNLLSVGQTEWDFTFESLERGISAVDAILRWAMVRQLINLVSKRIQLLGI